MLENIPDAIVFLYEERDGELRYTSVGGAGLDAVNMTKEELEGRPVGEGRPPEIRDALRSNYRRALAGKDVTFETEAEGRCFRFHLSPVTEHGEGDADENPARGAGIAQDITERTAYERELEQTRRRLDRFAELLAHDVKNPLTVLGGRLEMLREECDSEHIEPMADALDRIESLVDQDPAELVEGTADRDPVELAEVARRAWQNTATTDADLEVDLRADASAGRVVAADANSLQRLFENLYRNAVEHGGPDVTVRVGNLDGGFYVEDTGPGIPAAEREAVFERDYSGDEEGSGLGLFVVRSVADAHGWDVTATEGSDGGARFEVRGVEFPGE